MILEYKMDMGPAGMHTPYWVADGGYFPNPDNYTMLGWSPDVREYKIPDSVVKLTNEQVVARMLSIHNSNPYRDTDGNMMTTQQVTDMVNAWINTFPE